MTYLLALSCLIVSVAVCAGQNQSPRFPPGPPPTSANGTDPSGSDSDEGDVPQLLQELVVLARRLVGDVEGPRKSPMMPPWMQGQDSDESGQGKPPMRQPWGSEGAVVVMDSRRPGQQGDRSEGPKDDSDMGQRGGMMPFGRPILNIIMGRPDFAGMRSRNGDDRPHQMSGMGHQEGPRGMFGAWFKGGDDEHQRPDQDDSEERRRPHRPDEDDSDDFRPRHHRRGDDDDDNIPRRPPHHRRPEHDENDDEERRQPHHRRPEDDDDEESRRPRHRRPEGDDDDDNEESRRPHGRRPEGDDDEGEERRPDMRKAKKCRKIIKHLLKLLWKSRHGRRGGRGRGSMERGGEEGRSEEFGNDNEEQSFGPEKSFKGIFGMDSGEENDMPPRRPREFEGDRWTK